MKEKLFVFRTNHINSHSLKTAFPLLLLTFLLIFPKGGIKVSNLPLTWGYLLLFLSGISILFRRLHGIVFSHLQVFLALLPFQLISLTTFLIVSVEDWRFTISFFVHFFIFPFMFFLLFSKSILEINFSHFLKFFKNGVLFIACYGVFLFLFVHTFRFFFTIPLLTVNVDDLGILETTKCILRGDFFKLISTYNNGNIYGICILILLPLYDYLEEKTWKRSIVKLSLILTLSRTVWLGLLIVELFNIFYVRNPNSRRGVVLKALSFAILLSLIVIAIKKDFFFIFDSSLGGRASAFSELEQFYWIGKVPFQGFSEIVYLSAYKNFGIFGLLAFLGGMTSPLWSYYLHRLRYGIPESSIFQKTLIAGLSTYLILSCSDGAILFIPVMAFYWFLSALLLTPAKELSTFLP